MSPNYCLLLIFYRLIETPSKFLKQKHYKKTAQMAKSSSEDSSPHKISVSLYAVEVDGWDLSVVSSRAAIACTAGKHLSQFSTLLIYGF